MRPINGTRMVARWKLGAATLAAVAPGKPGPAQKENSRDGNYLLKDLLKQIDLNKNIAMTARASALAGR